MAANREKNRHASAWVERKSQALPKRSQSVANDIVALRWIVQSTASPPISRPLSGKGRRVQLPASSTRYHPASVKQQGECAVSSTDGSAAQRTTSPTRGRCRPTPSVGGFAVPNQPCTDVTQRVGMRRHEAGRYEDIGDGIRWGTPKPPTEGVGLHHSAHREGVGTTTGMI